MHASFNGWVSDLFCFVSLVQHPFHLEFEFEWASFGERFCPICNAYYPATDPVSFSYLQLCSPRLHVVSCSPQYSILAMRDCGARLPLCSSQSLLASQSLDCSSSEEQCFHITRLAD